MASIEAGMLQYAACIATYFYLQQSLRRFSCNTLIEVAILFPAVISTYQPTCVVGTRLAYYFVTTKSTRCSFAMKVKLSFLILQLLLFFCCSRHNYAT